MRGLLDLSQFPTAPWFPIVDCARVRRCPDTVREASRRRHVAYLPTIAIDDPVSQRRAYADSEERTNHMRFRLISLTLTILLFPVAASAQITIDMATHQMRPISGNVAGPVA